jgi:enoyl-CoA hydratase/carnithine racemase
MLQALAEAFETSHRKVLGRLRSDDFKEGLAHFLEKRALAFSGR